jgi:hypothetical protein
MSYEASNDRWTLGEMYDLRQTRAALCVYDLDAYSMYMTQDLHAKLKRLGDPLSADACVLEQSEHVAISQPAKKAKVGGYHPKWR